MDSSVKKPKIIEVRTIVRALEFKVTIVRGLVDNFVQKDTDFIENANLVLMVLNLEEAVSGRGVFQVIHVQAIIEVLELLLSCRACPGTIDKITLFDDHESLGRVRGCQIRQRTGHLGGIRGIFVDDTFFATNIKIVSLIV